MYAANLHSGGAVGVAASFIDLLGSESLGSLVSRFDRLEVEVSTVVSDALTVDLDRLTRDPVRVSIRDDRPLPALVSRHPVDFDVALSVFGPTYVGRRAGREVGGFADGSMFSTMPATKWCELVGRERIKDIAKRSLLGKYDEYIVETHVLGATIALRYPGKRVSVVPNAVPHVFEHPEKWIRTELPKRLPGEVRFFYPARGYPHKNHAFIPDFARAFRAESGRPVRFVVTLTDDEAKLYGLSMEPCLINVGKVPLAACPHLYAMTDGVFFPSLLETYSSTPLEGQYMKRPIFASNVESVINSVGANAVFFDALDAGAAASVVTEALDAPASLNQLVQSAYVEVMGRPSSLDRARKYLEVMCDESL